MSEVNRSGCAGGSGFAGFFCRLLLGGFVRSVTRGIGKVWMVARERSMLEKKVYGVRRDWPACAG